jgi:hypothetical protein
MEVLGDIFCDTFPRIASDDWFFAWHECQVEGGDSWSGCVVSGIDGGCPVGFHDGLTAVCEVDAGE